MIVNGWDVDVGQVLAADYEAGTVFRVADLIAAIIVGPDDQHLFGAAPEMLAACKAVVVAWEQCHQLEKTDMALQMAKAAIARAEGDEPE